MRVTVDKHPNHNGFNTGCRYVMQDRFTGSAVELGPVMVVLKDITINGRVSQVTDKSQVMVGCKADGLCEEEPSESTSEISWLICQLDQAQSSNA